MRLPAWSCLHCCRTATGSFVVALCVRAWSHLQPHRRLLCTTSLRSGALAVRTLNGNATVAYDEADLILEPFVQAVTPSRWDPQAPETIITIEGVRCVWHLGLAWLGVGGLAERCGRKGEGRV